MRTMHGFGQRAAWSLITVLAVGLAGAAEASTWKIDPGHTSAQFAVRHLMVSTVRGTIAPVTGTLNLDAADVTKSTVESTIDVNGIDTREPKRDAHLKSPDFFDAAKYPTITFKSKKITKLADTKFQVTGDLTIRGVTREVVLDVDGQPKPVQDPMGNLRLGASATTKLNRKDFGITWTKVLDGGGVVVGDEVTVTIEVELVKAD
ncbi:MAG: yceI1 [Deltaproteobacteria bacterium]|jgi:polyisoprenoid-binding protein YceI|nr:yceI1 [Deltaproteobacteria bacterium]